MKNIFYVAFASLLLLSCTESNKNSPSEQDYGDGALEEQNQNSGVTEATFVHTVFFWMKEDLSTEEARFFEKGLERLGKTPSILSYKWGKPAGTPREVVDNSYTYAWIVEFATVEDQDAYQVDPIHTRFIEESQDLWTKVQVYDTLLE